MWVVRCPAWSDNGSGVQLFSTPLIWITSMGCFYWECLFFSLTTMLPVLGSSTKLLPLISGLFTITCSSTCHFIGSDVPYGNFCHAIRINSLLTRGLCGLFHIFRFRLQPVISYLHRSWFYEKHSSKGCAWVRNLQYYYDTSPSAQIQPVIFPDQIILL